MRQRTSFFYLANRQATNAQTILRIHAVSQSMEIDVDANKILDF